MSTMQLITPPPWPPPPLQQPPLQQPCKPGVCTTTCRQYCNNYFYLQPPPLPQQQFPLLHNPNDSLNSDSDDDSSRSISPLMAALIAVLAAAFLCLFYYTVVSRFCKRRRGGRTNSRRRVLRALDSGAVNNRVDPLVHDPPRPDTGLDEAYIRQITVFRYKRDDGLVEGTECAVCLGEFKEEESLRLMPNCEHAFHIPCIDTWLATHSSCPLCRSTMNPLPARSGDSNAGGAGSVNVSVAALRVERSNDHILVVRELESHGEVVEVVEEERLEEREKENG